MKKKLTLWIFFFPLCLFAQQYKNGSIIFDMHGKKKATDTTTQQQQQQYDNPYESDEDYIKRTSAKHKSSKNDTSDQTPATQSVHEYWRTHGLFQPIFHAGINACQIDGDGLSGYHYVGAEFGIGAQIRLHPVVSLSMEFNYSMVGAKQPLLFDSAAIANSLQKFQVQIDYIQVPLALNINAVSIKKQQLMFLTMGLAPAIMVRFKEVNGDGQNVTNLPSIPEGSPPHHFDLQAFGGLFFVIHQNYAIGGEFSYSITRIRGPNIGGLGLTRLLGEYNNDLTIDFRYILDAPKRGGTKRNKR